MVRNLKYLREKRGLSQSQLADELGVTQQSVNKYENHTTEPDIEMLIRIAKFFDTSVDFLVGNTNIERKYEVTYRTDLNDREMQVMEDFRDIDESSKNAVEIVLNELKKK